MDESAGLRAARGSSGPGSRVSKTNRSVLWIAEDSALHAEVSRQALAADYAVEVFPSGVGVLEAWATGARPNLLLLDWYMPDVSGLEVCRFVRQELNLVQLPVLVLTGAATAADLLEAFETGVNDVVRKPITKPELAARVAGLMQMASLHSSLKQAEQNLRIEAAFRERFMGMLAHDLRQPLNAVLMANNVLALESLSPKGAEVSGMQLRAVQRMQRMVTDLLDFTRNRPETGLPIQRRTTDFAELARLSLAELRPAFPGRLLELKIEGPCTGEWDPDRIAQILSNLIGNAIEHGAPTGPVLIHLSGDAEYVNLRVSNRGPALPEGLLSTLFEPFRRAGDSKRTGSGLGLGLHIVHQIVRAHGGTISVQDQNDETHFVIQLPRTACTAERFDRSESDEDSMRGDSDVPPPQQQLRAKRH